MTDREYSLKFFKQSRYDTSIASNNMYAMRRFFTGFTKDVEEECWAAMLHDNIDLSRLIMHDQQVEDNTKNRRVHEVRRPSPSD